LGMSTHFSDRLRMLAAEHVLALEDPEASEERVLAALAWLEEDEEHYLLAREVSRFSRICDRWSEAISARPSNVTSRRRRSWLRSRTYSTIAASLALVSVGLAVLAFQMGLLVYRPAPSSFEYFTDIGEVKSIALPDGTRVVLGAASGIRITYDDAFRRITLSSGEAFFDVSKDKDRPLIVATADGEVTALGTAFNVHRSPGATTVTLLRGLVKVQTSRLDDDHVRCAQRRR
jgi:transmembrane sensor